MVKNLPANAMDMGLIPGLGSRKIPHALERLSRSNTATEPVSFRALEPSPLNSYAWSRCFSAREAMARGAREAPARHVGLPNCLMYFD